MLPRELHLVASRMSSSRESSPTFSDVSGSDRSEIDTVPVSPQEVHAMHIDNDVREFREDMKKFVESFIKPNESSGQTASRKWRLCELLLVGFMRNKVACDSIKEQLVVWNETCDNPDDNLVVEFHELMVELNLPVFKDIGYDFAKSQKPHQTSIFVVDWMARQFLPPGKKIRDWEQKVSLQWFESSNTESADEFLERAEAFLEKQVKGESWGLKILGKVIKVESYVVFFRMEALAAILLREFCSLQKTRDLHRQMQIDASEPAIIEKKLCTLPVPISLVVSSSNWHISFAEYKAPNMDRMSEIAWRLRRIACMSPELLEDNECSMRKVDFVEWEPLYNLQTTEIVEPPPAAPSVSRAANGGAAVSSELSSANRHDTLLELYNGNVEIVQAYLKEFSERFGQYEDAASGNMMIIDQTCIFVKTFLSEYVANPSACNGAVLASQHDDGHGRNGAARTQNPETLQERIKEIESSKRKGAEDEEERRMFLRRMGYHVGVGTNVHDFHSNSKVIDSAHKLLHRLLKGYFLSLLGPPACGKTVTMLQVACAAASAVQKYVDGGLLQATLPPRIPLFMRAAELSTLVAGATQQPRSLEALVKLFIAHTYPPKQHPRIAWMLSEFLKLQRVLIIIDGLDEAAGNRSIIETFIDEAAAANNISLMISTRDYAFETSRMQDRLCEFESVRILPLDEEQRNRLIGRRLPDCGETANFIAQLEVVSLQTPEMATSPFLLALMIEVFMKDDDHKIPTQRCDLYDKQVDGILVRHKCFRHLVTRCKAGSFNSLRDMTAHRIFQDKYLYQKAKLNDACRAALRLSLCADTGHAQDVGTASLDFVSLREFLEVLAFVCQIRLERRDFQWDSEDMQKHMQAMWRHGDSSLVVVGRFLLDLSSVGLLSKVGDGQFRFSHLTLQEYLAASCAVRLFGDNPQNLLNALNPLHSRWNREVVQFAACMPQLQDEVFEGFCQLVLQSDDGTGAHCELVQDFLKERERSAVVQHKVQARLNEIRGVKALVAGLCPPSLEMRSCVLSEMKKFGVPPDPFASTDGTVTELKRCMQ